LDFVCFGSHHQAIAKWIALGDLDRLEMIGDYFKFSTPEGEITFPALLGVDLSIELRLCVTAAALLYCPFRLL
jgi:hypothetical protein